jgi:hypothetical protein
MPGQKDDASTLPIRLWVPRADGLMWYYIQEGKVYRQELACKMQFYSYIRRTSLSPNRRYLLVSLHAETLVIDTATGKWRNLTRSKRYPDGSYTIDVVDVRSWAPNNRYFLADYWRIFSVDPPRLLRLVNASGSIEWFGWYPDSRQIYYAVRPPKQQKVASLNPPPFYRAPITRGTPQRLSAQEVKRLLTDWDYLAFAWSRGDLIVSPHDYAYTLNRKVRVAQDSKLEPGQILVERRSGEKRMLQAPRSVNVPIEVQDIDAGYQNLLVMDSYWHFYVARIADNHWTYLGHVSRLLPGVEPGDVPNLLAAEFVQTGYLFYHSGLP